MKNRTIRHNHQTGRLLENWDKIGRVDPFWGILTMPDKKGQKWDQEEFFATGIKEIKHVMEEIKSLGIKLDEDQALDFGCGVGRLTQALAKHFSVIYGVDISEAMIGQAIKYNRKPKCHFIVNNQDNLSLFEDRSFDFIYSNITLQHMPPALAKKYLKEFLRMIKPNGLIVFQMLSKPKASLRGLLFSFIPQSLLNLYRHLMFKVILELYWIEKELIIQYLETKLNAKVVSIQPINNPNFQSYYYFVTKK